jgi:hypothetical protein
MKIKIRLININNKVIGPMVLMISKETETLVIIFFIVCMIIISMESVDLDGRAEHLSQYRPLINLFLSIISLCREIIHFSVMLSRNEINKSDSESGE